MTCKQRCYFRSGFCQPTWLRRVVRRRGWRSLICLSAELSHSAIPHNSILSSSQNCQSQHVRVYSTGPMWTGWIHAIYFIRNVYKERFLVLVKIIKLVRNWLVKSSKVYKVLRNKTSQKWHLEKKMPICKKKYTYVL